jgi:hypothetical protein
MTLPYQHQAVAFLTQHGKETLIGPLLNQALGCRVIRAEGFDTDQLGTFSGEVPRPDSQVQTARRKARIGMDLLGTPLGMASEGAFVTDPFGGLMPWNIEVLVWIDDSRGHEVIAIAQGPARSLHRSVGDVDALLQWAAEAGFPEHHAMLRPEGVRQPLVRKGLNDPQALISAFEACRSESPKSLVLAENDLRAFCNPTRQDMIVRAAEDLVKKLLSTCPQCRLPGYWIKEKLAGLPCGSCGLPTRLSRALVWRCDGCGHSLSEPASTATHADPSRCDHCNP